MRLRSIHGTAIEGAGSHSRARRNVPGSFCQRLESFLVSPIPEELKVPLCER